MKRSFLLLASSTIFLVIHSHGQSNNPGNSIAQVSKSPAQQPRTPPTKRAVHQLEILTAKIELSQDQVLTLNTIYLEENMALDSLNDHPSNDPKQDGQIRREIYHKADVAVYACLNDSQQLEYVLWKQEQRLKNLEKKNQSNQAVIDSLSRQQPQTH